MRLEMPSGDMPAGGRVRMTDAAITSEWIAMLSAPANRMGNFDPLGANKARSMVRTFAGARVCASFLGRNGPGARLR